MPTLNQQNDYELPEFAAPQYIIVDDFACFPPSSAGDIENDIPHDSVLLSGDIEDDILADMDAQIEDECLDSIWNA